MKPVRVKCSMLKKKLIELELKIKKKGMKPVCGAQCKVSYDVCFQ